MINREWVNYKNRVLLRVEICCRYRVWPVTYDQFRAWLGNFSQNNSSNISRDEVVALYLIDRLIYRSKAMALSGYSRVFSGPLRRSLIDNNLMDEDVSIDKWRKIIKRQSSSELDILFLPLSLDDGYGDSGPSLYRTLDPLIKTSGQKSKSPKAVVYIDDCTISGDQLDDFINKKNPYALYPNAKIYYSPLIAYETAIENTRSKHSDICMIPVEILDKTLLPFEDNDYGNFISKRLGTNISEMQLWYNEMKDKYCSERYGEWYGYNNSAIPLAFEWGAPNNSLGIYRMEFTSKANNWVQLFRGRS